MMSLPSSLTTASELLRLPRGVWRHELVKGVLRRMTPAGHVHGRVAAEVGAHLTLFVRARNLGAVYAAETGFLLRRSPDTVRAPDAAFVTAARLSAIAIRPDGYFPGAPDLAVEVLSPSDAHRDIEAKIVDWLDAGCRAVLVLDPVARLARLERPAQMPRKFEPPEPLMVGDLLPGWRLDLTDLFR